MHIDEGANVQHCQSVRGQMSLHAIFGQGANVRGGGGGHVLHSLRLHAVSTVRILHSTNNFQNLLPTVRVTPLNLFSASTVNLHGASNSNMFRNNLQIRLSLLLICSRDLECTLVFLSAMPRSATVAIIYALRLLSLHL